MAADSPAKTLNKNDWAALAKTWGIVVLIAAAAAGVAKLIELAQTVETETLVGTLVATVGLPALHLLKRYLSDYAKRFVLILAVGLSAFASAGCLAYAPPPACHYRGTSLRSFHNSDGSTHVYEVLPGELNIERQPAPAPAPS